MPKINPRIKAAILEVVNNQIENREPPETKQTYDRLRKEGHSDQESRRLIGCVVSAEIFDVLKERQPFDPERFIRAAQYEAFKAVNRELIALYRDIGWMIVGRQKGETRGKVCGGATGSGLADGVPWNAGIFQIESACLKHWDYSSDGAYFVTICTKNHRPFFGEIVDGRMHYSWMGEMAAKEWENTKHIRSNVTLDAWAVMPNHVHGIIVIKNPPPTIHYR